MATSLPKSQQMDFAGLALIAKDLDLSGALSAASQTVTTVTATTVAGTSGNFTNIDAGASGTVGTVDLFPTTASKGKLTFKAADSSGDTTTTVTNASQATTRTYTIPDAGANASFMMTQGAQTVVGANTFSVMPIIPTATVAAAGADQAGATAVTTGFTLVTGADDTKGVRLPTAVAGLVCIIANGVANKDLKIYPATSDAINAITANDPYTIADATTTFLVAYDATTWYSVPLLAS